MITARGRLLGTLREFFDTELRGVFIWDDILLHQPEASLPLPNGKPNRRMKHRERVTISFGGYDITASSPDDMPPLGWVEAKRLRDSALCGGHLDQETWTRLGRFIRGKVHG